MPPEFGDWPIPMQGPQALSRILAPASIISDSAPFCANILSTCFEPGAIERLTVGQTVLPFKMAATFSISIKEEFVQEPMQTWSTLILPISVTSFTRSGMCGIAAIGASEERSISIVSSYTASSSAFSSIQSSGRDCAVKKAFVISSDGKTEVVAPSSAPMLVMVARSGTERVLTPSPVYSIILPTPPFTVILRKTSKITSFAATYGFNLPVK